MCYPNETKKIENEVEIGHVEVSSEAGESEEHQASEPEENLKKKFDKKKSHQKVNPKHKINTSLQFKFECQDQDAPSILESFTTTSVKECVTIS